MAKSLETPRMQSFLTKFGHPRLLLHGINLVLFLTFLSLGSIRHEFLSARSEDRHLALRVSANIGWKVPLKSNYLVELSDEVTGERVTVGTRPNFCCWEQVRPESIQWNPRGTQVTCMWGIQGNGTRSEIFYVNQNHLAATQVNEVSEGSCGT